MISRKYMRFLLVLLILAALIAGCTRSPQPSNQISKDPSRILINEIFTGTSDNNNLEFIELHNTGSELIDLQGWSLTYRLVSSEADLNVFKWESSTLVPPYGYLLLVRRGQDFGLSPDGYFEQSLNNTGGGLGLRNEEGSLVDAVGWGKNPPTLTEGTSAPEIEKGWSLARKQAENGSKVTDSDDNFSDFLLVTEPNPQNVTYRSVATEDQPIQIILDAPQEVQPGEDVEFTLSVENLSQNTLVNLIVLIPFPDSLEQIRPGVGWSREGNVLQTEIDTLDPGDSYISQLQAQAPWTYGTIAIQNARVTLEDDHWISIAPVLRTEVSGGVIPINVARTLLGQNVIVEGIATMYTDGFYAGSSGTKFYIDDGSAGVQVYVPGGMGVVQVPIGARVRVEGESQLYRGAIEIVPAIPEQVELLAQESGDPVPAEVSIRQAFNDLETLPGRLVEVIGTLVRAEEFSYSYELDLVDEEGQMLTAYIDKLTNATIEPLIVGENYRVVGIMEIRDGNSLINPRQAEDMIRIFQPIVYLEANAPSAVESGSSFTVTLVVENHSDRTLDDLTLWAKAPVEGATLIEVGQGGILESGELRWEIPPIPSAGGRYEVQYRLRMQPGAEVYTLSSYGIEAQTDLQTSELTPLQVFNGGLVPIWAIQGVGSQSPYRLDLVTTSGIVTGVFPELHGFWMQDPLGDNNKTTSEGLFIFWGDLEPDIQSGDSIRLSGQVREISGQTQLFLSNLDQLTMVSRGNALPASVSLDPPADLEAATLYYEALEGMLVEIDQPAIAVGPTSRYGETFLLLEKHDLDRVPLGEETGWMIVVDDGSEAVHYDQSTMSYALAVGDRIDQASGPLAYTFGAFKLEPLSQPSTMLIDHQPPSIAVVDPPGFSVMTWNVENLFDILEPHPSDLPRPRKAEYELAIAKIAATIVAGGRPSIIGLQEVENIKVLQDLAEHDLIAASNYQAILLEGTDSRGIDVGYLIRTDQVEIVSYEQRPAPEGLTSRPPLLMHVRLLGSDSEIELYILNNHFTSLSGGIEATEPRRNAQALWNIQIIEEIKQSDPDAQFLVLGDLNSFTYSLPIDSIRQAGLVHAFDIDPDRTWYSYVYQGTSQTLDHILMTPGLFKYLVDTIVLHTNADFPPPLANDPSPLHASDHDPIITIFSP